MSEHAASGSEAGPSLNASIVRGVAAFTGGALIAQLFFPQVKAAGVAVGALYMCLAVAIWGALFGSRILKTRTWVMLMIVALLKLPLLVLVLYLLSRLGADYIYSALAGSLSFLPAAAAMSRSGVKALKNAAPLS